MPGSTTRLGPMKEKGLTRADQTGSVNMLRPATWISVEAWPIMVMRNWVPSILRSGFAGGKGLAARFGQRERSPLNCHFSSDRVVPGPTPLGLKKRVPSK
jgi:hypothetical protein